jgi:hypothetical protein
MPQKGPNFKCRRLIPPKTLSRLLVLQAGQGAFLGFWVFLVVLADGFIGHGAVLMFVAFIGFALF